MLASHAHQVAFPQPVLDMLGCPLLTAAWADCVCPVGLSYCLSCCDSNRMFLPLFSTGQPAGQVFGTGHTHRLAEAVQINHNWPSVQCRDTHKFPRGDMCSADLHESTHKDMCSVGLHSRGTLQREKATTGRLVVCACTCTAQFSCSWLIVQYYN